jgi:hypothetical protein
VTVGQLVDKDREGNLAGNVGVEVRRVAGEDHGAAFGFAAHHLQPSGVPFGEAKPDAGGEVLVAVVEHHVVGVELAHQLRDRLAVERRAHVRSQTWRLVAKASSASCTWNFALGKVPSEPAWS